jgi:hypothetical protein
LSGRRIDADAHADDRTADRSPDRKRRDGAVADVGCGQGRHVRYVVLRWCADYERTGNGALTGRTFGLKAVPSSNDAPQFAVAATLRRSRPRKRAQPCANLLSAGTKQSGVVALPNPDAGAQERRCAEKASGFDVPARRYHHDWKIKSLQMRLRATLLSALTIASCVAATSRDSAVILNSGSTNTMGFKLTLWSDGNGSVTLQNRGGTPSQKPKSFQVSATTTARFFSDLVTARKENAPPIPCMKSASFSSTTRVTWQGWTSPDLECPQKTAAGEALVKDVQAIRQAAGIESTPLHGLNTPKPN